MQHTSPDVVCEDGDSAVGVCVSLWCGATVRDLRRRREGIRLAGRKCAEGTEQHSTRERPKAGSYEQAAHARARQPCILSTGKGSGFARRVRTGSCCANGRGSSQARGLYRRGTCVAPPSAGCR